MASTTRQLTAIRIAANDSAELERFYQRLSEESRHLRFFAAKRELTHVQSSAFCSTDHAHREGYVATQQDPAGGLDRIVGHVCLEPAGVGRAEMAIAVADELQRAGVGTRLVDAAIVWAQESAVATLTATMLASNPGIHRLIASLGLATRIRPSSADVSRVDIAVPGRLALAF
jgi:acetyltransferase